MSSRLLLNFPAKLFLFMEFKMKYNFSSGLYNPKQHCLLLFRFLRSGWVWLGPQLSAAPHLLHRRRGHHPPSPRNHSQTGGILFVFLCLHVSSRHGGSFNLLLFSRRPTVATSGSSSCSLTMWASVSGFGRKSRLQESCSSSTPRRGLCSPAWSDPQGWQYNKRLISCSDGAIPHC